ncbi:tagaturonate reductase [Pedobacter changchengzhani]|uniref:Tagaturonate reductase n=1 Tax=Pedobacter changchengzhani TaxID=2529274 RepID=A0A4R5MPB8_9SPHI|nr:tagaturonate reductase [Pedobacter changchengzhani]TDG37631.1 tagaturonate reductase [Pedobacter changchengzhani]
MILSKQNLNNIDGNLVAKPNLDVLALPEKVIQFGTGVLLRGLPDYFIDKANRQGIFNGRVLVVKSTSTGITDAFATQDNLYTVCVKGIENGENFEEYIINSSISRVLSASANWAEILKAAHNPEMQIVISNTTEVGIIMSEDKITEQPPRSYPGKLLAFLFERFTAFNGSAESGMVILPTELISDNADKLKEILLELAIANKLSWDFIQWLKTANHFCKTLVDRIVPGKLPADTQKQTENLLGYTDELMIMAEPFRLWAIESPKESVQEILSFASADKGIFIVPSISKFKELKLRLLNGTHTLSCGLALLSGFSTVKEAMADEHFANYVSRLMNEEIAPSVVNEDITLKEAIEFANSVIDRFSNPFLDHQWKAITLNYTSKIQLRNIPLIRKYYSLNAQAPSLTALGFAAYLVFMDTQKDGETFVANVNGEAIPTQDESAEILHNYWRNPDTALDLILGDRRLWDKNLNNYEGFAQKVKHYVSLLRNEGGKEILNRLFLEQKV